MATDDGEISIDGLTFAGAPQLPFLGYLDAYFSGDHAWCRVLDKSLGTDIVVIGGFAACADLLAAFDDPTGTITDLLAHSGTPRGRPSKRLRVRAAFLTALAEALDGAQRTGEAHFRFDAHGYRVRNLLAGIGTATEEIMWIHIRDHTNLDCRDREAYYRARHEVLAQMRAVAMRGCTD